MNPEFRRQLWLQFTATRLALLPALLLACFLAVFFSSKYGGAALALSIAGAGLFVVLVWGMGTLAAGASVMDEISERTWDQQRMSAMQPWAMAWGKLAGSSAYGWYGGALCLLVTVPSALLTPERPLVASLVLVGVLTGVSLQALLLAVNLQMVQMGGPIARRGGVWTLLLLMLWGIGPLLGSVRGGEVVWWGSSFQQLNFTVLSMVLLTVCTLTAAWRSMAEVLAVRQLPWAWPALAVVVTLYLTGFGRPNDVTTMLGVMGLGTSAALTYFSLLTEPQPRPLWQRVVSRLTGEQWRAALLQVPRWPSTLALALFFALWLAFTLEAKTLLPWTPAQPLQWHALAVVLLMLRDAALALFFAFSIQGRRPVLSFSVAMMVLYGLLPWLFSIPKNQLLLGIAQPLLAHDALALIFASLHAALALALLRWRWVATGR